MKAFQYEYGSLQRVVHENEIAPALAGGSGEVDGPAANVRKVLGLELNEAVTFPSGAKWTRLADDTPKFTAIICRGRGSAKPCKYCSASHTKLCDYPVTRNGKFETCDIPMCDRCTTRGGPNVDYCRPHAKMVRTGGAAQR